MDIKPVQNKPDQNVIDGLEALLIEAKSGDIISLCFAADYANNEMNRGFFGVAPTGLIGAATIMLAELVDSWRGIIKEE